MSQEELFVEAKTAFIRAAEKFDVGKKARLTSFAWFDVTGALQVGFSVLAPPDNWSCFTT